MCDQHDDEPFIVDTSLTRRSALLALSAVAATTALPDAAFAAQVVETDVLVKTADGSADAALFRPAGRGTWPAVLLWPDILGLRPVFREMGRRLAARGYVVLVPNPFYRTRRAPIVTGPFDFGDKVAMGKLMVLKATLTDARIDADTGAFLHFLDAQRQVDRRKGAGVQGYCFSGPFAFRAAALRPDRIRAVATFHGGGLVSKEPGSPHLLIPKSRAAFLVAIAQNDDRNQPDAKDILKASFAAARRPATVEVYPADHGWTVAGSQAYNEPAAERAWAELLRLYRANLR
ncbi:dienelactone hydrolase family protein [Sphingomonas sp. RB1R13]|uniref:dienelactone hydrolase family protein n=1 Tax=Sphingomonas sp. RB1R13 TaxID=3096159 RepID=UPI002FCB7D0A